VRVVILRSVATKNLLSQVVDSTQQQILRYAQDDKEQASGGKFQRPATSRAAMRGVLVAIALAWTSTAQAHWPAWPLQVIRTTGATAD
jgi:hypothetical protein